VESIARSFALGGLDVVVVCPTTVYGPGDRTLNSGTLIGRIARGGVIPVPPGGCNVVDVRDVASGVVAALRRGRSGERYVLGGWNLTFREVFRTVASVTAASPLLVPIPAAARQPAMLAARLLQLVRDNPLLAPDLIGNLFGYKHACSDKARGELGWTAARPFRRSVEDAWTFYRREGLL
jgi:dihydroflavonol-4-reductase